MIDKRNRKREYYKNHKEQFREYRRKYIETHRKEYLKLRKKEYQRHKEKYKERTRRWRLEHLKHYKEWETQYHHSDLYLIRRRKRWLELRMKVVDKLGGKCSNPNCAVIGGMRDIRALQIDHVHGGGVREFRTLRNTQFLKKVLSDTEGNYQLLCANCNWIKRYENNENRKRKEALK